MTAAVEVLATLDLRHLEVHVREDEGDLILVLDDGEVCVEVEGGFGPVADAVQGAERLSAVLDHYAALLRVRAGSRTPFGPRAEARESDTPPSPAS